MACVRPHANFDANADAQALREAMKGMGTSEQAIIDIIAKRTVAQRQEIAHAFKAQFGQDLMERLEKELSGNFRQAIKWSFYKRPELNAAALHKAMKGTGTDEAMLIDVICTAKNDEIKAIKEAFKTMTGKSLEATIEKETSGDFKRVLVAISQAQRESGYDEMQAKRDTTELYDAGEKFGTDETTLTRILCTRSFEQIRKINEFYQAQTGHDLIKALEKETSGDYKKALTRIVLTSKDPVGIVADMLYRSMKGAGTNDDSLIRIVLAHSEDDLAKVKAVFDASYEKPLVEMIGGDTSGDYKKFLLAIIE
ncbi:hypothetical protein Aperf_G00000095710 [Anoplocephala perfoliata]